MSACTHGTLEGTHKAKSCIPQDPCWNPIAWLRRAQINEPTLNLIPTWQPTLSNSKKFRNYRRTNLDTSPRRPSRSTNKTPSSQKTQTNFMHVFKRQPRRRTGTLRFCSNLRPVQIFKHFYVFPIPALSFLKWKYRFKEWLNVSNGVE